MRPYISQIAINIAVIFLLFSASIVMILKKAMS
jgi:hypothetical protein